VAPDCCAKKQALGPPCSIANHAFQRTSRKALLIANWPGRGARSPTPRPSSPPFRVTEIGRHCSRSEKISDRKQHLFVGQAFPAPCRGPTSAYGTRMYSAWPPAKSRRAICEYPNRPAGEMPPHLLGFLGVSDLGERFGKPELEGPSCRRKEEEESIPRTKIVKGTTTPVRRLFSFLLSLRTPRPLSPHRFMAEHRHLFPWSA